MAPDMRLMQKFTSLGGGMPEISSGHMSGNLLTTGVSLRDVSGVSVSTTLHRNPWQPYLNSF